MDAEPATSHVLPTFAPLLDQRLDFDRPRGENHKSDITSSGRRGRGRAAFPRCRGRRRCPRSRLPKVDSEGPVSPSCLAASPRTSHCDAQRLGGLARPLEGLGGLGPRRLRSRHQFEPARVLRRGQALDVAQGQQIEKCEARNRGSIRSFRRSCIRRLCRSTMHAPALYPERPFACPRYMHATVRVLRSSSILHCRSTVHRVRDSIRRVR